MTALTTGVTACFKALAANTSATPTVAFNGLTATTVKKSGGALANGDIGTIEPSCVIYDGAAFELINPQSNTGTGTDSKQLQQDNSEDSGKGRQNPQPRHNKPEQGRGD